MKLSFLLSLLITFTTLSSAAFAEKAPKPVPPVVDQWIKANCPHLLEEGGSSQFSELMQLLIQYYRNQNSNEMLAQELGKDFEVVLAKDDALIVQERGKLKIVWFESLGAKDPVVFPLMGTELVDLEAFHDNFIVKTREVGPRKNTTYIIDVFSRTTETHYAHLYDRPSDLKTHRVGDDAIVYQIGKDSIYAVTKFSKGSGEGGNSGFAEFRIRRDIVSVDFPEVGSMGLMARVKYKTQNSFKKPDGKRSQFVYAYFDLTDAHSTTVMTPKFEVQEGQSVNNFETSKAEFTLARWQGQLQLLERRDTRSQADWLTYNLGNLTLNNDKVRLNEGKSHETYDWVDVQIATWDDREVNQSATLLIPKNTGKDALHPMVLPKAKVIFQDKIIGTLIESDHRDEKSLFSKSLGWNYVFISNHNKLKSFTFATALPLESVTKMPKVPVTDLVSGEQVKEIPKELENFIHARVQGADNPGALMIDLHSGDVHWIAGLHKIEIYRKSGAWNRPVLIWGEQNRSGKTVPLLTVVSADKVHFAKDLQMLRMRQEFLASLSGWMQISGDELKEKLRYLAEPDNVLASPGLDGRFYKAGPLGSWAQKENVKIRPRTELNALEIRFDDRKKGDLVYLLDLDTMGPKTFSKTFAIDIDKDETVKSDTISVVAAEHFSPSINPEDLDDGIPGVPWFWRERIDGSIKKKDLEETHLAIYLKRSGGEKIVTQSIIPGRVKTAKILKQGTGYYAIGTAVLPGLGRDWELEFRWNLREKGPSDIVYARNAKPMYKDDDFEIYVSGLTPFSKPQVMIHRGGKIEGREIKLEYEFKDKEKKSPLDEYFDYLFGRSAGGPEKNSQEIESISRNDELLFITTKESADQGSMTFIYNLNKNDLLSVIPNFKKHVDIGNLRFYIGEANHRFSTIVAVFSKASNKFITYFDFGQVKLDTSSKDGIYAKDNMIYFRTSNGSLRVYDTVRNYFLGTLPTEVEELLAPLSGWGAIWNKKIFQTPGEGYFGREAFMKNLMRAFPLRPGRFGGNHTLIVAESGAGATDTFDQYVYLYITGQLDPVPLYKAVFLKLDVTSLASGTMFRGTKAEKYKSLAEVARALQNKGYRLILGIDGLHTLLPEGDVIRHDDEGDFFSGVDGKMEEGTFDVLATTTPGGAEQLQRKKGQFYGKFKKIVRLEPMTREETRQAVIEYLTQNPPPQTITPDQVELIVERISRLNTGRALPGPAFDVVKSLISEMDEKQMTAAANKKKSAKSEAVTDHEINSVISRQTAIPEALLDRANLIKVAEDMRAYLKSRVKGIDAHIDTVVDNLIAFARGFNRPDWPIIRVLCTGPTGTGKTELIKAIADFLGAQGKRLKISGEDWKMPGTSGDLKKLIVKRVNETAFSIIHLDEFEKMHPENQDVVLSLGDGEISDEKGNKISTGLTILYATTNLGAREVSQKVFGANYGFVKAARTAQRLTDEAAPVYEQAIDRELKPEIRNRFDYILQFPFLADDVAYALAADYINGRPGSGIESLRARLKRERYLVEFTDNVIDYVASHYVDPALGGRRLTINIENGIIKEFLTPMSLSGKFLEDMPYVVDYSEDQGFMLKAAEKK